MWRREPDDGWLRHLLSNNQIEGRFPPMTRRSGRRAEIAIELIGRCSEERGEAERRMKRKRGKWCLLGLNTATVSGPEDEIMKIEL